MNFIRQDLFFQLIKEDFNLNNQYTYHTQMSVLIIKSLLPLDTLVIANKVDYKRYAKELDLWRYYRSNFSSSLCDLSNLSDDIYFTERDDSIFSRLVPINIVNFEKDVLLDETIKNILYTSGNIYDLMEYVTISLYLYYLLNNNENIREKLKEDIIEFSQSDFMEKYNRFYRLEIADELKFSIDFERAKIEILNILNYVNSSKFKDLSEIINGESHKRPIGNIIFRFINNEDLDIDIPEFYKNLGDYLDSLIKGSINRKHLEIDEYILPDVFSYEEGESFFHSLLNQSTVLDKLESEGKKIVILETKMGYYKFTKS